MPSLHLIVAVALGGSVGALARFGLYEIVHRGGRYSPWTTLLINLLGSLVLGAFLGWISRRGEGSEWWTTFVTVGILGAFTTFSTYSGDALRMLQNGRPAAAVAYLGVSAAAGLFVCAAGYGVGWAAAR
jgi:CrcB protein